MSAPATLYPHKSGDYWDGLPSIAIAVDGAPLDLTGATILLQFKRYTTDSAPALELSSTGESPGVVVGEDPTEGVCRVPGRVITLKPAKYYWDMQITLDAKPITYASGTWTITPDVSR